MEYKIAYRKENRITAAPLENVMLRGEIGSRADRFFYERASGEFARTEILREAEECFAEQYDDEYLWGLWRGEFWGKLALSGVRTARMKNDKTLADTLRASAHRILMYQREDGYLSTYRDEENLFRVAPELVMRDAGWACTYNWSVWSRKYTLWGLLEIAELCDDAEILSCAARLADNLLDTLERLRVRVRDCGVMDGMPACSILKPLLILYRLTGTERYRAAAAAIVENWEREDGERPNLISNALSGKAPEFWYSDAYRGEEWIAKAYEMMSCFDGLCEWYRVSGDEHILDAVKAQYETLKRYETNILGSVGYCEQFRSAAAYPDAATEICDVIHWMRLCYELFCLTGEAKYMESFENAFLNAFLAGIYEDGKNCAFFVRSSGRHWSAEMQVETKYQHCCLNNVPRGFCNAAEAVFMRSADGFYVNSYIPARAVFGNADFKLGNGYLAGGSATLTVRGLETETAVFFRIPEWSKTASARIGETVYSGTPGTYLRVLLPAGDCAVYLRFDMTPRILDFEGEYRVLPEPDYHIHRWCDVNGACDRDCMVRHPMSVLRRGALLYARSKRLGCTEEEMFSGETVWGTHPVCTASVLRHDRLLSACRVTLTEETGKQHVYTMCDFASAANFDTPDGHTFQTML